VGANVGSAVSILGVALLCAWLYGALRSAGWTPELALAFLVGGGGGFVLGLVGAIWFAVRHKNALREAMRREIDAALVDFPDLAAVLGPLGEQRGAEIAWEIIHWLDEAQPTRKASVHLTHPGTLYPVGGELACKLSIDGRPVGEGTSKAGVNLNLELTPGYHLLTVFWPTWQSLQTHLPFECPLPRSYEVEIGMNWRSIARVQRKG
jgi:hypothetical protein